MSARNFYTEMPAFDAFAQMFDKSFYNDAPHDWYIVISDIVESTKAIDAGKYKDVNTVGASCIISVLNALGDRRDIPYIFGGDGASFLVPEEDISKVAQALQGAKRMAKESFDITLRIGAIKVSEIMNLGSSIKVAKYQISTPITIAMFSGGGMGLADQLIKKNEEQYAISKFVNGIQDKKPANFSGLECRWSPVKAKKGHMLTLMVQNRDGNDAVYEDLLDKIVKIFGTKENYRPNHSADMKLSPNPLSLRQELNIQTHGKGIKGRALYIGKLLFETILGMALFKFNLKAKGVEGKKYIDDLVANTDFQKFDDALRMVIDSTPDQTQALERYLQSQYEDGKLFFGTHIADSAIITCLIFNRVGKHLHLIDGASGGYAMAAKGMKQQISDNKKPAK